MSKSLDASPCQFPCFSLPFLVDLIVSWSMTQLLIWPRLVHSLLAPYVGRQECDISSLSLFSPPQPGDGERASSNPYCQSRDALLNAMSNGGRHGFDAAYTSQGKCQIDGLSFLVSGHFGFSEGLQRGNSGLLDTQTDLPFQDALIVGSLAPKYATFFGNSMESSLWVMIPWPMPMQASTFFCGRTWPLDP